MRSVKANTHKKFRIFLIMSLLHARFEAGTELRGAKAKGRGGG